MQARIDWVLIIFGTQVIKKKRPVRPAFSDYLSVSYDYVIIYFSFCFYPFLCLLLSFLVFFYFHSLPVFYYIPLTLLFIIWRNCVYVCVFIVVVVVVAVIIIIIIIIITIIIFIPLFFFSVFSTFQFLVCLFCLFFYLFLSLLFFLFCSFFHSL